MHFSGKKNVYEQIVEEYTKYIRTGALRTGEALPSCRRLAEQLGINPNTVQRAWAELERRGLIVAIPKKGAFVAEIPPEPQAESPVLRPGAQGGGERAALLGEAARQIGQWREAGLTEAELSALIRQIYGKSEGET